MPTLSQSLFWLIIHSNANLSVLTLDPANLWHYPSEEENNLIIIANWYDFHQIFTLTFNIDSLNESDRPLPLIISFFFLTPRWFLVPEFDATISLSWENTISSNTPSIITLLDNTPAPASWFLLKQNDPDLLRLIIASIIQDNIFIPPYSSFILTPLGITPPLIKLENYPLNPLNADPTSNKSTNGGHKLCTQKLCNSSGFLTRPKINYNPE